MAGYGAIINGAIGLLGIGNSLSNQSQQQVNYDEQMRFAKYQYEDLKKYNSMKNQVARMRAAGINPALAIGSGQLGTAASSSSMPSAPNFDSLGVGEIGQSIASGIEADSNRLVRSEDAKRLSIDNETRSLKNLKELLEIDKRLESYGIKNDLLREEFKRSLIDTSKHSRRVESEINKANNEANYYDSLTLINNELLNWLPQEKKAEILKIGSEVYRNYSDAKSNRLSAQAAWRNALKQHDIYFDNKEDEEEFIDSVLDAQFSAGNVSETDSRSNNYGIGGFYGELKSGSSTSQTRSRHVYSKRREGKKRY